ncbi:AMP-binding protein [Nocardia alni]|uniref:AMP-binding protein n=1 Tax=Nocardia alni TaxID=2815723 RepID=UPI001C242C72|nr:AMP-binding protein [Nocardia alni]
MHTRTHSHTGNLRTMTTARSARRDPNAVVVADGDCELTVAELDRWSNRLARLLLEMGAGSGTRVVIAIGSPIEEAVAERAIRKIDARPVRAVDLRGHSAAIGVTTKATRPVCGSVDWLVLDDRSTLLRYLTGSDAPLTPGEFWPATRTAC